MKAELAPEIVELQEKKVNWEELEGLHKRRLAVLKVFRLAERSQRRSGWKRV